jgi:hypothetical protein
MTTLRIEHPIVDFALWRRAFDGFAEARSTAGVLGHRVMRPVDDEQYVAVELDFPTVEAAEGFLRFLRTTVWADPQRAPALAGTPVTRIFQSAD